MTNAQKTCMLGRAVQGAAQRAPVLAAFLALERRSAHSSEHCEFFASNPPFPRPILILAGAFCVAPVRQHVHSVGGVRLTPGEVTGSNGCYTCAHLAAGPGYDVEVDVWPGWTNLTPLSNGSGPSEPGGIHSDTFVNSVYVDVKAHTFGPVPGQAVALTAEPHPHRSLQHLHSIKGYGALDILMERQDVVLLAHSRWAVSLPPIHRDAPCPR